MSLKNFCCIALPYVLQRQKDGSYIALNREYEPLGFFTKRGVEYGDYPIKIKFKRSVQSIMDKIGKDYPHLDSIYLYDDATTPWSNRKLWDIYQQKLFVLSKQKVDENYISTEDHGFT